MLKKCPPAYERKFKRIVDSSVASESATTNVIPAVAEKRDAENEIRVMTWNILARGLCDVDEFWIAPKEAGDWQNYRLWRTIDETIRFYPDVICLQEIDAYEDIKPYLHSIGFLFLFFFYFFSLFILSNSHFKIVLRAFFVRNTIVRVLKVPIISVQTVVRFFGAKTSFVSSTWHARRSKATRPSPLSTRKYSCWHNSSIAKRRVDSQW